MTCLNCGKNCSTYLCDNCKSPEVLEDLYNQIMYYRPDNEQVGPYVRQLMEEFEDPKAARPIMLEIINLFPVEEAEYYRCMYSWITRDTAAFEPQALSYLDSHSFSERRTQKVLYSLLSFYVPDYIIKAQRWCDRIKDTKGLSFDLYNKAADYYSKVGDYDVAEQLLAKLSLQIKNPNSFDFLYTKQEYVQGTIDKLASTINSYRTKKPYWPKTEARKRLIAEIYDAKGIEHPRVDKPSVVKESDFDTLVEATDERINNYCAFWCADVFSISGAKAIYQIAAVKVRNDQIFDTFQSLIKPWDGTREREAAAKAAGVDISTINGADDVDLVMKEFFEFVGDDTLLSTGALSTQAKCISRAARYSGISSIKNPFFDLLDYAADISPDFDYGNNTREYLLRSFSLSEGKDAISKAKLNVVIYSRLKELDK